MTLTSEIGVTVYYWQHDDGFHWKAYIKEGDDEAKETGTGIQDRG